MDTKKRPHISETLAKGLTILDLFCDTDLDYSLGDIARLTGINKTSVFRYVNTLVEAGYLKKDSRSNYYKLGIRSIARAYSFLQKAEIVKVVKPLVDDVHQRHGLHVDVGAMHGDAIYLVYRRASDDTEAFLNFTVGPGLHYLATGKAAMAFLEPHYLRKLADRIALEPRTLATITDKKTLLTELEQARHKGYVLNREEFLPGYIAIGAPLIDLRTGGVIGAVSFDSSTAHYSVGAFEKKYAVLVVELAKKLSAAVSAATVW